MAGENGRRSEEKHRKKKKRRTENEKTTKDAPTVSIAIAGSIIDNAQSLELATRLAGQIARAATIFRIDEGLLPPLDAPHHVRKHEWSPFREGVTLEEHSLVLKGTLVDVGLSKNVMVEQVLEPGLRVTVAMGSDRNIETDCLRRVVTSLSAREEMGKYWGYRVRYASNLSCVIKGCPYKDGYDHMIGTSEHGLVVSSSELMLPTFRHLLIAFGGLAGLEESIEEDNDLKGKDPRDLFNSYLNICPDQGSRTIRTEEAIFISLQYFQEPINKAQQRFENK